MAAALEPADGAGKQLNSRCRGWEPGRGNPRSRAFNYLGAEAKARGGERGARGVRAGWETPRPLGAQAAGASGQRRVSGRIISGFSALLSCLRLPPRRHLPLPSDADFGWSPEEAGSSLSSAQERFPLGALSLLLLHFSVPNAAAASCHRLSSQHGGGGGSCLSERKSGTRGEHGPSSLPPPPPPPLLPTARTPSASLRRPPSSMMGSVVYVVAGGRPNAP